MAIMKEWRCEAHGEFENTTGKCPGGCDKSLVAQEFRTAPRIRRSGAMKFVDDQLKGIAADHGLSDMRNDGKGGLSVMAMENRRRQLAAAKAMDANPQDPRKVGGWVDVPHAKPGFSRSGDKSPVISGADFGTRHSSDLKLGEGSLPPLKPMIVARTRDT